MKGLDDLDKHRTIPVVDRRIGVSATAIAEDGITNKKLRLIEAKRMVAGEAEVPLEWSESTPPVGIMLDEVNHYFVFAETNGLCDNQSVAATLNNVIEAVQTVLIDFDPFFPFDWPR